MALVTLLPLPAAPRDAKETRAHPPEEDQEVEEDLEEEQDCCLEEHTTRSTTSIASSSSSSDLTATTALTSSSSSSSLSEDTAACIIDDAGNAHLLPNSDSELEAVGGVGEAHQEEQEQQQQQASAHLLQPEPRNGESHHPGTGTASVRDGDSPRCDNVLHPKEWEQGRDSEEEEEETDEEDEEEVEVEVEKGRGGLFHGDKIAAALDKILEESENLSQVTSESDLDDWAAERAATLLRQPASYPRPTLHTSFTTSATFSTTTRPNTMSPSQDLHFAGSTAPFSAPAAAPATTTMAAAGGQYSGTEIGWARDGRPAPLLDVTGARSAVPPDFSMGGTAPPRRNLRHSGPMPPPSRPLYSPAASPKHLQSGATSIRAKSELPSPSNASAATAAAAAAAAAAAGREYGRSPSPANNLFAATPSPGRTFYHTGLVSPARAYNNPDFASRAFGQVFGNSKAGGKSEQGKSQLANLEEELSTLLRNRASSRRSACNNNVATPLPLPPVGRRGFSMELHKGSHHVTSADDSRPVEEPVHSDEEDGEEEVDEDGDAVYEESMRELEILVRAGSRFNDAANTKKLAEPAPLPLPVSDSSSSSSSRRGDHQGALPVEKQVVHVELPFQNGTVSVSPPKTKLSWVALSKPAFMTSPRADNAATGDVGGLDRASTRLLASQESFFSNGAIPPLRSPRTRMAKPSQKKVLKPLGDDHFSLDNASLESSEDGNDDDPRASTSSSVLRNLSKDLQALVGRVSWSSRKEVRKSRSLDDSVLPDKLPPFLTEERDAADIAKAKIVQLLTPDSTGSSLRMLSRQDSKESSSRKLSRQDSKETSSRRLSRQDSRDRSMRKQEATPDASVRKTKVDAAKSTASTQSAGRKPALQDYNSPSFKTLLSAATVSSTAKPSMDIISNPIFEQTRELDAGVLNSLQSVPVVPLRGGSRYSYGSFAESETDGPHIDLTASPAAKFLEDSTPPDDFSQPFRTSAAVPFKWEEAPGKPKSPTVSGQKAYALQPPPRLQLVSGPLTSYSGAAKSPGSKLSNQNRLFGPQEPAILRSPPRHPEQSTGAGNSIPASPIKSNLGVSPKSQSVKNAPAPSPDGKKGMSRLQNLLHGGCTLADVAHLSHALRLPLPPSKEEIARLSRNIDILVSSTDRDSEISKKASSEDATSPNSILCGPADMGSSSWSLSSSPREKEDAPEQLGSFQCFSLPAAQRGMDAADMTARQPSMKRNRSIRDGQAGSSEDGSKHHSGQLLGSILYADSSKAGSSRGASGRSSRRVAATAVKGGLGRFPSLRTHESLGSGSEWEEVAPKSPGTPRPLAKKSKSNNSSRALVRVRRFPRFMITLKRVMRRAFCLGTKSRLGNSQRYASTPAPMYAITLH